VVAALEEIRGHSQSCQCEPDRGAAAHRFGGPRAHERQYLPLRRVLEHS
jgi:hypothetical protein